MNKGVSRRQVALAGTGALAFLAQSRLFGLPFVLPAKAVVTDPIPTPDWSRLEAGPRVTLTDVVDGDTVEVRRGRDVRLVGTQAPKLPLGRDHVDEWPLAREAKQGLEALIAEGGRDAQLYFGGRQGDRHGRHLAHIVLDDGTWLQGAMVASGLARVYTFADNRSLIPDLLQRERLARHQQLNIWAHPYFAVRQARQVEDLLERANRFELVEGRVRHVDDHRARWYLNFGETWREDFTVTIDREHDQVFADHGIDLFALEGQSVRVRGWVMRDGGPLIRVDHPEPIELLG